MRSPVHVVDCNINGKWISAFGAEGSHLFASNGWSVTFLQFNGFQSSKYFVEFYVSKVNSTECRAG